LALLKIPYALVEDFNFILIQNFSIFIKMVSFKTSNKYLFFYYSQYSDIFFIMTFNNPNYQF